MSIGAATDAQSRSDPAGVAERLSLWAVRAGAVGVVLAASTLRPFELDRFFVPKELVFHATALAAGLLAARAFGRAPRAPADFLLIAFLVLGIGSASLAANPWLAMRALAMTASSIVVFWAGRALRQAGLTRGVLVSVATATVIAAVLSLAQAYGADLDLFSSSRAPGGTLGNRNFVAHAVAFGFPALLVSALGARSGPRFLAGGLGLAASTAALVLTRSRAAWLAFAVVIAVVAFALLACAPLRRDGRTWRRLAAVLLLVAAGVAAALLLPNTLRWRSDDPYVDTIRRVADYEEGSGRGRLVQYERSLRMALRNPVFGVGPGNWPVAYPAHAPASDPSMNDSEPGTTLNPWPSSDWVAWVSERGVPAALTMAVVFVLLGLSGLRQLRTATDAEEGGTAMALLGTVAGAAVTGAFDAVLLLAVPSLLVWLALGALYVPRSGAAASRLMLVLVVALSALGAARSGAQLAAMQIYATRGDRPSLQRAARIDPGSYRVHLRLARGTKRDLRCAHALAARSLYPHAAAAGNAARGCRR